MNHKVILIGSIDNNSPYTEQDITRLLGTQQIELLHGDTFTGRPGTRLYSDAHTVLKVRSEIRLDPSSAKRWAELALQKEQAYHVHHPHKTWFFATLIEDSITTAIIGNIAPRLQPLHELFSAQQSDIPTYLNYLNQLFSLYFRTAKQLELRLDEGLSNFGVTSEGTLYYLDDDIYSWDRFVSCAHVLGVYFRSLPWLTSDVSAQFGKMMRKVILEHFNDAQYLTVLAEQLKDVFIIGELRQQAVDSFIKNLDTKQVGPVFNFSKNRYLALLADVHANLPALDAVLNFLESQGIEQGIIIGDIVGYGPYPTECIERVQASKLIVLKGNHDHGLATGKFKSGFSSTASWVLQWSYERVSNAHKEWLAELPPILHEEKWLALHGAPVDPTFFNAYVYEMTYHDNLDALMRKNIPVCFHGHTHQPGVYTRKDVVDSYHTPDLELLSLNKFALDLNNFDHALACPGSVGQPRNHQMGAQLAIYDQIEHKISYHTIDYDTTPIIQEMEKHKFPASLIALLGKR